MSEPKVGDKIYIPSAWFIDRGEDDVMGGLATIRHVRPEGKKNWLVSVEEIPDVAYSYNYLLERQDELRAEFGDNVARPDPDYGGPAA